MCVCVYIYMCVYIYFSRLALYGDMGNVNAQSLTRLQEETQRGLYDAIFHVGESAGLFSCSYL